jgi:hypothetical protein
MPLGPGGLDSNGIWQYGEDDSEALASDLLNLGMQSVSDAISDGLGSILQVVSTAKTDTFSTSSTSFTDVTGLTATITPSSTSSKIMIVASVAAGIITNDDVLFLRLAGGNAETDFIGDAASNRIRTIYQMTNEIGSFSARFNNNPFTMTYLDSPSSTSELTYRVQIKASIGTVYVNRSGLDSDASIYGRGASSITLMEVAG